jgi:hypothetical protein
MPCKKMAGGRYAPASHAWNLALYTTRPQRPPLLARQAVNELPQPQLRVAAGF